MQPCINVMFFFAPICTCVFYMNIHTYIHTYIYTYTYGFYICIYIYTHIFFFILYIDMYTQHLDTSTDANASPDIKQASACT